MRRLAAKFLFIAAVVSAVALYHASPNPLSAVLLPAAILVGLALIDSVFARHAALSPLRVYFLLACGVLVVGLGVYALTFLGVAGAMFLAFLLTALVAVLTLLRRPDLRRFREDTGLCPECGYDLRATADRCPECNTPVPASLERRRRVAAELRAARERQSPLPARDA